MNQIETYNPTQHTKKIKWLNSNKIRGFAMNEHESPQKNILIRDYPDNCIVVRIWNENLIEINFMGMAKDKNSPLWMDRIRYKRNLQVTKIENKFNNFTFKTSFSGEELTSLMTYVNYICQKLDNFAKNGLRTPQ
jgi:hypothetical protein